MQYFLGMKITSPDEEIFLNWQKYITGLLYETRMSKVNEIDTPLEQNKKLSYNEGELISLKESYHRFIGNLMSCPNITYTLKLLNQFIH